MPYYKRRQKCTQESGEEGSFLTIKKDDGKRQCWKSEQAFKNANAARHYNESNYTITNENKANYIQHVPLLRALIREILSSDLNLLSCSSKRNTNDENDEDDTKDLEERDIGGESYDCGGDPEREGSGSGPTPQEMTTAIV